MSHKLDILVFSAHPDDAELGCSGTIIKHIQQGKKVGIVDLTRGELGTRGTEAIRAEESKRSSSILGIASRDNAGLPDGFLEAHKEYCIQLIRYIRLYQPEIVLCNALEDRHPDHGKASELASRACFLSGLIKIETEWDGAVQAAWRPKNVYHYIQDRYIKPDFVVDISAQWETKLTSIKAFSSQFYDPSTDTGEPQTYISGKIFLDYVEARAREFGHAIGVEFGEGFTKEKQIGVKDLFDLI
ncbi:MAG: bacillithiol biosynthesis deacetylase BshB1 [Cytophagales bacterium]|nr:bacillithiol biosynthesis deacetylase BshB1 [Cytophaga sp.]